jgi:hypothetical protein
MRNTAMMLEGLTLDKTDARSALHGYAARPKASTPMRDRSFVKVQDEVDWAALLIAVRDRQDKAAFAALFRHFAPRIKAFLMKSGASAALAEECAQDVMATLWQKSHLFDPSRASVATWVFTIARKKLTGLVRLWRCCPTNNAR